MARVILTDSRTDAQIGDVLDVTAEEAERLIRAGSARPQPDDAPEARRAPKGPRRETADQSAPEAR